MTDHNETGRRLALPAAGAAGALALAPEARAQSVDLSRQAPTDLVVELGDATGAHVFRPDLLRLRVGTLYRLILRNPSRAPHYFTSDGLANSVWTRKAQVVAEIPGAPPRVMAEIKGAIRELEVYPGFAAEWWFVPVQAGDFDDLRCGIRDPDGRSHTEHGMRGRIIIE
ncbi:MAG: biphenyl 2,3-dioxygenase [Rubritepida sp.]|nr:biphenyl 2,3-dioxygenase [Rubritepida sp.]